MQTMVGRYSLEVGSNFEVYSKNLLHHGQVI